MSEFEIVLRGAQVFDGSLAPSRRVDVALRGGRIAAMGTLPARCAREEVDLDGLALAPGFIDVHTHDDRVLLTDPAMTPKLSQGVTSVITGNCGISLAPLGGCEPVPPLNLVADAPDGAGPRFDTFAGYFAALEARPPAINMAALVGHSSLRVVAMPLLDRPASEAEVAHMQRLLREALQAGVLGLSTGTYYAPAQAADVREVLAVAEPLRGSGGLIASHIRDEGQAVLESMREVIGIAAQLGVRQVISHHKVIGRANAGRSTETLALLDETRRRGAGDVCLDCYPYAASSTVLRLDTVRQAARTLVTWSRAMPVAAGRDLDELARELGLAVPALVDALQPAGAIYFSMDEGDVERILAYPQTMVGSDGLPHDEFPHPRLWGAFPRVLGYYARERGLFSLETAVHKMTGLPAARFGLVGRGCIQPGAAADLVAFDPERVIDAATFAQPLRPALGIHRVYVNGRLAWHEGCNTGARAGQVLRRAGTGSSA
jgi:N-acyl-D-amino-acid deacylase